jgi:hypothetical protein
VVTALVITVVVLGVLGIGLAALAGAVGGRVGGWLAGRVDDRRRPVADRHRFGDPSSVVRTTTETPPARAPALRPVARGQNND